MKKTLIAVAALVATGAFAQSTVLITGTFDPSYAMSKTTSGTDVTATQSFIRNSSRGTTGIIFRVTEDLGGGLKALGLAEFDFSAGVQTGQQANQYAGFTQASTATQNNVMGANGGELYTGLSGSMGSIKLGAANTPSLTSQGSRQPFGTKLGGGFGTTQGTSHVRESSSVVLASNTYAGFSAAIGNSRGTNADAVTTNYLTTGTGSKNDVGLFYAAGPLRAGVTYFSGAATSTVLGGTQQNYFVQYDIGAATIYGGMHSAKTAGVDANSGTNIALKYALNATTNLLVNVGKFDDKTSANNDSTLSGMGVDYALSKTTTAYARYENRKVDNVTVATAAKQVLTTAFGLQVNF